MEEYMRFIDIWPPDKYDTSSSMSDRLIYSFPMDMGNKIISGRFIYSNDLSKKHRRYLVCIKGVDGAANNYRDWFILAQRP
jgi:hypothetical protein